jgi:hypothetical protein
MMITTYMYLFILKYIKMETTTASYIFLPHAININHPHVIWTYKSKAIPVTRVVQC